MEKKDFKKIGLFLSVAFIFSADFMVPVLADTGHQAPKEQVSNSHEEEIDVQGERNDKACPVTVRQGKILGASHGTHTKYLPSVNIPYRESFTFFSVADGDKTYLVRRQGLLHVRDYVGVIVSAPCRQTIAEVAKIGALSGAEESAKG